MNLHKVGEEFSKFIKRGNVVDMAVGVVVGASFGKIVTGLVNYIINPFVGLFIKSGSLDNFKTVITAATEDADEVAFYWGTWIQTIIDFLITAAVIFIAVKIVTSMKNKVLAKKIAEEKALEEKKKAEEQTAKLEAEKKAAELAERQSAVENAIIEQAKLLGELKDIIKNK